MTYYKVQGRRESMMCLKDIGNKHALVYTFDLRYNFLQKYTHLELGRRSNNRALSNQFFFKAASFSFGSKWFALFVKKKSTCGSIIASVKLCEPFSVDVLGNATAHFIGVGPNHGSVMANIGTKPVKMIQHFKVCTLL